MIIKWFVLCETPKYDNVKKVFLKYNQNIILGNMTRF